MMAGFEALLNEVAGDIFSLSMSTPLTGRVEEGITAGSERVEATEALRPMGSSEFRRGMGP